MIAPTANERLAILLSGLSADAAEVALSHLEPARAEELRRLRRELGNDPPTTYEYAQVIDDFFRFFRVAVNTLKDQISTNPENAKQLPEPAPPRKRQYFAKLTPSDDPVADLNRLDPYQIAQAIGDDHAKTIALVLREIDTTHAAKVLEQLSPEARAATIIQLTAESTVPAPIVRQVLKTTVQKACSIECRQEAVEQSQVLANLLRSVPKAIRVELMKHLTQADPAIAEQVKSRLYIFNDILRLSDRDVQKLLSQIETGSLAVALQRCDQQISDKLLTNLSKRARESILEEMEFKQNATDEEIESARAKIVETLSQLDESGEIKL